MATLSMLETPTPTERAGCSYCPRYSIWPTAGTHYSRSPQLGLGGALPVSANTRLDREMFAYWQSQGRCC